MSKSIEKIFIASDHAGYSLKDSVYKYLLEKNLEIVDLGTDSAERSVDYPDYANKLADNLSGESAEFGILICGSGVGISIAANRKKHIRAALCMNEQVAELSRRHNDANVLCLGARLIEKENAFKIIDIFLSTAFEGDRHNNRVEKLSK